MKKPFIHASAAALYIVGIVFAIDTLTRGIQGKELFVPMIMLSLLVLSALIMGFLFLSKPLTLYIDGEKKEAYVFFFKTVGFFACYVLLFLGFVLLQLHSGAVLAPANF
jgi:hypothetical protein